MSYLLPLFPLPGAVLFPRTHLPLHIFEPRYRQMMEHAMDGDRRIGIAQLRPGFEDRYFDAPPVFKMLCAARILFAEKLPDGRWDLMLEGVERVELLREPQTEPFRIGEVEPIAEGIADGRRAEAMELASTVATLAESIGQHFEKARRTLVNLMNTHQHPAVIADVVAAVLVPDPYARQSLLEEMDVCRRLQLVRVQLMQLAESLADPPPVDVDAGQHEEHS